MRIYKQYDIRKNSFNQLCKYYPKREARKLTEIILTHFLDISIVELISEKNAFIEKVKVREIEQAVAKLEKYEPIQYILGKTEFYGLTLKVNENTLIPRPETEELVHWILEDTDAKKRRILDIGTGSGCIAIALAKNIVLSNIYAIDISEKALNIAKENAKNHQVAINFSTTNILDTRNWEAFGNFDIIVSNPPYVRDAEKENMLPNVLKYEPASSLFVGDEDSLIFYNVIADFAKEKLCKNAKLFFEINEKKGKEVCKLLDSKGFISIELKKDFNGKDRMIRCQKP